MIQDQANNQKQLEEFLVSADSDTSKSKKGISSQGSGSFGSQNKCLNMQMLTAGCRMVMVHRYLRKRRQAEKSLA